MWEEGVRSIRGRGGLRSGTEVDEKNGVHLWARPRCQRRLRFLLSYIFGHPENNRRGLSDSAGVKLCLIRKWSDGKILRMER